MLSKFMRSVLHDIEKIPSDQRGEEILELITALQSLGTATHKNLSGFYMMGSDEVEQGLGFGTCGYIGYDGDKTLDLVPYPKGGLENLVPYPKNLVPHPKDGLDGLAPYPRGGQENLVPYPGGKGIRTLVIGTQNLSPYPTETKGKIECPNCHYRF